jgi:hypothetical protein
MGIQSVRSWVGAGFAVKSMAGCPLICSTRPYILSINFAGAALGRGASIQTATQCLMLVEVAEAASMPPID